jgi:hypothetical protein
LARNRAGPLRESWTQMVKTNQHITVISDPAKIRRYRAKIHAIQNSQSTNLLIAWVDDLKSPIAPPTIHFVRTNPAANGFARFEHRHVISGSLEISSSRQPRQTRSNNNDFLHLFRIYR